jgi:hypothetical protein
MKRNWQGLERKISLGKSKSKAAEEMGIPEKEIDEFCNLLKSLQNVNKKGDEVEEILLNIASFSLNPENRLNAAKALLQHYRSEKIILEKKISKQVDEKSSDDDSNQRDLFDNWQFPKDSDGIKIN